MAADDSSNTEDQQVQQILAALSETVPRWVADLATEGERSAVIVGAAQLDNALEQYLLIVLQPQPGGDDKLFGDNGVLRNTYAKINIAYRLGIINADVERALQLVRRIRNDFAHSMESASLSEGPQRDRLDILTKLCERNPTYQAVRRGFTDLLDRDDLSEEVERGQFSESLLDFASVVCVLLMSLILVKTLSQRVEPSHRAFLDW
jgi:hypothetical protein